MLPTGQRREDRNFVAIAKYVTQQHMREIDRAERALGKSGGVRDLGAEFGEQITDRGARGERDFHTRPTDGFGVGSEEPDGDRDAT
jgi:hypothetical protein